MPEEPIPKSKPKVKVSGGARVVRPYAELHVTSNFSFLRGASHPEELVAAAYEAGCAAVAVTDVNSFAGIVRAHEAAKDLTMPFIVGCHLQVRAATGVLAKGVPEPGLLSILVYPTNRAAYGRLCRLLTFGKRRATKGACDLTLQDVLDHHEGTLAVVVPPAVVMGEFVETLRTLREVFDEDRLSLAASHLYNGHDRTRLEELAALGRAERVPLAATNDVHYHDAGRQPLQDVLTCIRLSCTIDQAGFALFGNAERYIKGPEEMMRLFRDHPEAVARTLAIAERAAGFSLKQLKYEYPSEVCPQGVTMMEHLIARTWAGASERFPEGISEDLRARVEHEFGLIRDLNYPAYFLTVDDIVSFARSKGILCQGRGAAANSAVCYCLGITAVDPTRVNLLVERFISKERDEPPDIDIDFEHERREEVIQYLYEKYGRDRAALTAEVICYRRRSAVREVGKALGLSLDCVDCLAKAGDWWEEGVIDEPRLRELGLNPKDLTIRRTVWLASQLIGFPRHLSQHVGGFVITQGPLCETVPIENASMPDRTVIEWDKDDIDAVGMMKVDILGLGMLTAIRKGIDLVNEWDRRCGGGGDLQFHTIPPEDAEVYEMLCNADAIGVFQVESRAQMTMLPRLRPQCYYDLVIEVAIVRPGPIQGGMVHPYLQRRQKLRETGEQPTYPSDKVKAVLERTLGVPIFQEQAMRLVMVAAGFTAGESDQLRRAMAAWKRKGDLIEKFGHKIVTGMLTNGYTQEYADRVVDQIKGFSSYGFPESHAASFALLVYVSAWLKCHHPAAFAAALINSQPMGFYQPAQIVRDAAEHGVRVLPIDVNYSGWDCRLEDADDVSPGALPMLRLGMRLVSGLRERDVEKITAAVQRNGRFENVVSLWRGCGMRVDALRTLAQADAFTSMGLNRQQAFWAVSRLRDEALPMFDEMIDEEEDAALPGIAPPRLVIYDYAATGLSLKAHPISFVREQLRAHGIIPTRQLSDPAFTPQGGRVAVAGLVLIRQRPATAQGVVFMTIEDETGVANLVVFHNVYQTFRTALRHSIAIVAWGKMERQGQVIHVLIDRACNLNDIASMHTPESHSRDFR